MRCPLIIPLLSLLLLLGSSARAEDPYADRVARLANTTGPALDALKAQLIAAGMPAHDALAAGPDSTAPLRLELRRAIRKQRDAAALARGLIVHEWGAVAYKQGLEPGKIDLGDDASDLPEFAQRWSELAKEEAAKTPDEGDNLLPGVKLEIIKKPIVYFYSDKRETITFTVACPHGLLSTWWPKASSISPKPGDVSYNDALTQSSMIQWRNFDLIPPGAPPVPPAVEGALPDAAPAQPAPAPQMPTVPDRAWWWPICRDTDSALLNVNGTLEKFLFYRGILADSPPAILVDGGASLKYTLTNTLKKEPIRHLLAIHAEVGKVSYRYLPSIAAGATIQLDMGAASALKTATSAVLREQLADLLEAEGLFPKEAAGMSKIWQKTWFEEPGLRIIYFNPRGATYALLPITIDPRPAMPPTRTLLVSIECLKDSQDNVVQQLLKQLGDGDFAERETAQKQLIALGKKAEKLLRQTLKKTDDEEIRNRITAILQRLDPDLSASPDAPPTPDPDPDPNQ